MNERLSEYRSNLTAYNLACLLFEEKLFPDNSMTHSNEPETLVLFMPWGTLAAFYIELLLKSVIELRQVKVPKTHKLSILFENLESNVQAIIMHRLHGYDFQESLHGIDNLFIESRYVSGRQNSFLPEFLRDFRFVLKDVFETSIFTEEQLSSGIKVHRKIEGNWELLGKV